MQNTLFNRRKKKFQREEEHFNYLLAKGIHPVEMADRLIHFMLDVMRTGFKNQYPNATDEEIDSMMREQFEVYDRLKRKYRSK
ncbi:MAG: hypothetical protein ACTSYB_11050 [Candidatus Helarchaeota archaeon]